MVTSYNILSVCPSSFIRDTQLRLATPTQRQFAVYPGGVAGRFFGIGDGAESAERLPGRSPNSLSQIGKPQETWTHTLW